MVKNISQKEVHERVIDAQLDQKEIHALLLRAVCDAAGLKDVPKEGVQVYIGKADAGGGYYNPEYYADITITIKSEEHS